MNSIFDQSDPTWNRDITVTTPQPTKKLLRTLSPAAVVFAISAVVAGAAESSAPIAVESASSSTQYFVQEGPDPFAQHALNNTWTAAMSVIRGLGADPDEIVRGASETVGYWRQHPDSSDDADGSALDEDEA